MNKKGQIMPMPIPMYFPIGGGANIPDSFFCGIFALLGGIFIFLLLMIESMFHPIFSDTLIDRVMEFWLPSDIFSVSDIPIIGFIIFIIRIITPVFFLYMGGYLACKIKDKIKRLSSLTKK